MILENINNTNQLRKYRFLKNNTAIYGKQIEVSMDLQKKEFTVISIDTINPGEDINWKVYEDTTFPSALLREFLEHV